MCTYVRTYLEWTVAVKWQVSDSDSSSRPQRLARRSTHRGRQMTKTSRAIAPVATLSKDSMMVVQPINYTRGLVGVLSA